MNNAGRALEQENKKLKEKLSRMVVSALLAEHRATASTALAGSELCDGNGECFRMESENKCLRDALVVEGLKIETWRAVNKTLRAQNAVLRRKLEILSRREDQERGVDR